MRPSKSLAASLLFFVGLSLIAAVCFAETETVELTAKGEDRRQAIASGLDDAVARVVGTVLDSQTDIEDDEIIGDRMVSYTKGFVHSYEVLEQHNDEDGVVVRLRVVVRKEVVGNRPRKAFTDTTRLDGDSLKAQHDSRKLRNDEARAMLAARLKPLVEGSFVATQTRWSGDIDRNGDISVGVGVEVDERAYNTYVFELERFLHHAGIEPKTFPVVWLSVDKLGRPFRRYHDYQLPKGRVGHVQVVVFTPTPEARLFEIPEAWFPMTWRQMFKSAHVNLRVQLANSSQTPIVAQIVCLAQGSQCQHCETCVVKKVDARGLRWDPSVQRLEVRPWLVDANGFDTSRLTVEMSLQVPADEIPNVARLVGDYDAAPPAPVPKSKQAGCASCGSSGYGFFLPWLVGLGLQPRRRRALCAASRSFRDLLFVRPEWRFGGLVEHQAFDRDNAGSNSKTMTSDHRPVSVTFDIDND